MDVAQTPWEQSLVAVQARHAPVVVSQMGVLPEHCALDVQPDIIVGIPVQHWMPAAPGTSRFLTT